MSSAPSPPPPRRVPSARVFTGADTVASRQRAAVDRVCDLLPGWMFGLAGAALLAIVVLTPPWLEHREAAWRLEVMRAQAEALATQADRYERFAAAIRDDDPVVLERLAMTHLRMAVAGKTPLHVRALEEDTGDIGAWLAVPQPVIGQDLPAYAPIENRLTRLVVGPGPGRPVLLVVGLLSLVGGVLFNPRSRPRA